MHLPAANVKPTRMAENEERFAYKRDNMLFKAINFADGKTPLGSILYSPITKQEFSIIKFLFMGKYHRLYRRP